MKANRLSVITHFIIAVSLLLPVMFSASTAAQDQPDIVWQAGNAGPSVFFSSDGQQLLTGTKLWNVADGRLLHDFTLPYNGNGPNTAVLSPDGQYAAIGIQAFNQNLDVFRVSDGALIGGRISAHNNGTVALAFSPDGQLLASGGNDGTAKLWHIPDMTLIRTLNGGVGYRARVLALAFLDNGQTLALGGQAGVALFRVADGALVQDLSEAVSTRSLAVSPDKQTLAAGSNAIDQYGQCTDCSIKFWRAADGVFLRFIEGNNNGVISLAFSPDQQVIAVGSGDRVYNGAVRFFRLTDGALVKTFYQDPNNPGSYVTGVAYSPDGSLFALAREDGVVIVTRNLQSAASCAAALSPSSQMLPATGGGGSFNLTAPNGCSWTATSNDNWIMVTSTASGSGSAPVSFAVRENFDSSARSGQITVAGQHFTVMQEGRGGGDCGYTLAPTFATIAAAGGSGTINVTAAAGCAWEAVSRTGWLTITANADGMGSGVVSYVVGPNASGAARKGKISIAGQTFAIKQKAN